MHRLLPTPTTIREASSGADAETHTQTLHEFQGSLQRREADDCRSQKNQAYQKNTTHRTKSAVLIGAHRV